MHQIEISTVDNQLIKMTDNPLCTYKTFVKPIYNSKLSDYIKELTNINQEDIDCGKSFHDAVDDLCLLCSEYRIKKVLTWGPDRMLLKSNCSTSGYDPCKARILCYKFQDVSKLISNHLGYKVPISQHKTCQLLNVSEEGNSHDAYYDAINLSKIIKKFCRL